MKVNKIIMALSALTEEERRDIAAYLTVPTDFQQRTRRRDGLLKAAQHIFWRGNISATAEAMAGELSKYISGSWKSDKNLSMLNYATRDYRFIFLHRIARLTGGKTISSRQMHRILKDEPPSEF